MYQRIICFAFQETASEQEIQQHCQDFARLEEKIPQIISYAGGRSVVTSVDAEPQWESVHYLTFAHTNDIEVYAQHPARQEFIQQHKPIWKDTLVCNATIEHDA